MPIIRLTAKEREHREKENNKLMKKFGDVPKPSDILDAEDIQNHINKNSKKPSIDDLFKERSKKEDEYMDILEQKKARILPPEQANKIMDKIEKEISNINSKIRNFKHDDEVEVEVEKPKPVIKEKVVKTIIKKEVKPKKEIKPKKKDLDADKILDDINKKQDEIYDFYKYQDEMKYKYNDLIKEKERIDKHIKKKTKLQLKYDELMNNPNISKTSKSQLKRNTNDGAKLNKKDLEAFENIHKMMDEDWSSSDEEKPKYKEGNIMKGRADIKKNKNGKITIDAEMNIKKGLNDKIKKTLKEVINIELDKRLKGSGLSNSKVKPDENIDTQINPLTRPRPRGLTREEQRQEMENQLTGLRRGTNSSYVYDGRRTRQGRGNTQITPESELSNFEKHRQEQRRLGQVYADDEEYNNLSNRNKVKNKRLEAENKRRNLNYRKRHMPNDLTFFEKYFS